MNALSHGLTSQKLVLPGEDAQAFAQLQQGLLDEHKPAGPTETLLVEEMAQAHWRLDRVRQRQDEALLNPASNEKLLGLLHRYGNTYERTFYKALETLKKLQAARALAGKDGFVSQKAADDAFYKLLDAVTAPPNMLPKIVNLEEIAKTATPRAA